MNTSLNLFDLNMDEISKVVVNNVYGRVNDEKSKLWIKDFLWN